MSGRLWKARLLLAVFVLTTIFSLGYPITVPHEHEHGPENDCVVCALIADAFGRLKSHAPQRLQTLLQCAAVLGCLFIAGVPVMGAKATPVDWKVRMDH